MHGTCVASYCGSLPKTLVNVVVHLKTCKDYWCQVQVENLTGWLPTSVIYGVYAGDEIN